MGKKKKVRVDFSKNRQHRRRETDVTRQYQQAGADGFAAAERVRAKGSLSRKRTVMVADGDEPADEPGSRRGRVLMVQGLHCVVVTDDGASHRCYVRRLLKSIGSDERGVVATGDWVVFRTAPDGEGLVLRVEPRGPCLTRTYRRREQTIAANVDQVLIAVAVASPDLRVSLLDRYLVRAEQSGLDPVVCLNKSDLVDPAALQGLVGLYSQVGYRVAVTSVVTGAGLPRLRRWLDGRQTVVVGQSGVGKSSLLNALAPQYHLRVGDVSALTQRGRHTTTTAQMLGLPGGGTVIDTPGVRQFELSAMPPQELAWHFPEFRPFMRACHYPDCTHDAEPGCRVVEAVVDRRLSGSRYDSFRRILDGED